MRVLAVAVLALTAVWGLLSPNSDSAQEGPSVYAVTAITPTEARVLDLRSTTATVQFTRGAEGRWRSGQGTAPASVSLLAKSIEEILPLRAYRRLRLDAADPELGLHAPEIVLRVHDVTGQEANVAIGAPNFTGAGFYATRAGDSHVYLIPRGSVDILRSIIKGERFHSQHAVNEEILTDDLASSRDDGIDPWLGQALEEEGP